MVVTDDRKGTRWTQENLAIVDNNLNSLPLKFKFEDRSLSTGEISIGDRPWISFLWFEYGPQGNWAWLHKSFHGNFNSFFLSLLIWFSVSYIISFCLHCNDNCPSGLCLEIFKHPSAQFFCGIYLQHLLMHEKIVKFKSVIIVFYEKTCFLVLWYYFLAKFHF